MRNVIKTYAQVQIHHASQGWYAPAPAHTARIHTQHTVRGMGRWIRERDFLKNLCITTFIGLNTTFIGLITTFIGLNTITTFIGLITTFIRLITTFVRLI